MCLRVSSGKPTVPFSANVWMASQALTRMSSSGELSSSTIVAGVLPSTGRGSNCECEGRERCKCFITDRMSVPGMYSEFSGHGHLFQWLRNIYLPYRNTLARFDQRVKMGRFHFMSLSPFRCMEFRSPSSLSFPFRGLERDCILTKCAKAAFIDHG